MTDRSITPAEGTRAAPPLAQAVAKAFDAIEQIGRGVAIVARTQVRIMRSQERTETILANMDRNLDALVKQQQSVLQHRLGPLESRVAQQDEQIEQLKKTAGSGAPNGHA